MTPLTAFTRYDDANREYAPARLWDLFDGDRGRFNIGHECLDRHAGSGRTALRIAHADGRNEDLSFARLAEQSNRFARYLEAAGVAVGTGWRSCWTLARRSMWRCSGR